MATTNHLGIALVEQSQSQKEVTVNQAFTLLDALLNTGVKSRVISTPPGSPTSGDVYIVASSPTGDWLGQAGKIAYYDQIWRFITPNEGMSFWVNDEDRSIVYNGTIWVASSNRIINVQTGTTYTLAASDIGNIVLLSNASAVTLTLPNNFSVGFHCVVIQGGAGQVTFSPATGAFRRNRQSFTKTAGQYAVCNLQVITNSGGTAAEYILSGDASA